MGIMGRATRSGSGKAKAAVMEAWLELPDGKSFPLPVGVTTIGRTAPRQLVLAHPFVSSHHATITRDETGASFVEDAGSKNGTFLENRRLSAKSLLLNGAKLRVGPFELLFRTPAAGADASTTQVQDYDPEAFDSSPKVARVAALLGNSLSDAALLQYLKAERDIQVIAVASNVSRLLGDIRTKGARVVLLGLHHLATDPLALLADLGALETPPAVFVVASSAQLNLLQRLVSNGVAGAALDTDSAVETLACLRAVIAGAKSYSHAVLGSVSLETSSDLSSKQNGPSKLSDREIAVFHLVGAGKQNRDIAQILGVSVKTVETHKENIKVKLGADSSAHLFEMARNWVSPAGVPKAGA